MTAASHGATASRVGEIVGVSADTVRRHWRTWPGFPRPLFGEGAMLRWDAAAVEDWKRRRSQASALDEPASLEPDWAAIARQRGLALDRGEDPDVVCV